MIRHYLKVALRSMKKRRVSSFISIFGLAVGMAGFILISLYIQDEQKFERFHVNRERLFLLTITHPNGILDPNVPYAMAPLLADEFSDIETFTRIYTLANKRRCSLKYSPAYGQPIMDYENTVNLVDSDFFTMFTFPFVYGQAEHALENPNSMVISEQIARKYFGDKNPVGEMIRLNGDTELTISGVIRIPQNSHLQPHCTIPLTNRMDSNWSWADPSYVLLKPEVSAKSFAEKIAGSFMERYPGNLGGNLVLGILPLEKMHLGFGRQIYVRIFGITAFLILLIACFNYANLSSGALLERTREAGLRKTAGSGPAKIVVQFLCESAIIAAISLLLSLLLVLIALPTVNLLAGKMMKFQDMGTAPMFLLLLGLVPGIGILAGLYPAYIMSKARPLSMLKNETIKKQGRHSLRTVTVIAQFVVSCILIAGTITVFRQLDFIQNTPMGLNADYVIQVSGNPSLFENMVVYKQKLLEHPGITSVTAGQDVPYNDDHKSDISWAGKNPDTQTVFRYSIADHDYLETFHIELASGRYFDSSIPGDWDKFIINERAASFMGLDKPVGQFISFWDTHGQIIGVVEDYHHVPLHREILPQVFSVNPSYYRHLKYFFIRVSPTGDDVVGYIRDVSRTFAPEYPFSYRFLEEDVSQLYTGERQISRLLAIFASLAMMLSCMGIFGLAFHAVVQRKHELAVRKVMGCTSTGLIVLLSKELIFWVITGVLIAVPLSWMALNRWLSTYAYHIDPEISVFLIASMVTVFMAAVPLLFHGVRASSENPIHALRYE